MTFVTNELASSYDHWSSYWAYGFLHSCTSAFNGNYGDAIADIWCQFFSSLNSPARVLDIGTGNGALAILARDYACGSGMRVELHACDAANVDPARMRAVTGISADGISFHPRTRAEKLPFPDASFDAVISQYGIEYADWSEAIAEVARIMVPGGWCQFVMHHADSVIVATAKEELTHAFFLLDETRLIDLAARILRNLEIAESSDNPQDAVAKMQADPRAEAERLRFNALSARVTERISVVKHPDLLRLALGSIATAFEERRRIGTSASRVALEELETQIRHSSRRLADLLNVASTDAEIAAKSREMIEAGLEVVGSTSLYRQNSDLVGWVLMAQRR